MNIELTYLKNKIKQKFAKAFFDAHADEWIVFKFAGYNPLTYQFEIDVEYFSHEPTLNSEVLFCFQKQEEDYGYTFDECAVFSNSLWQYWNEEHLQNFIKAYFYEFNNDAFNEIKKMSDESKDFFNIDLFINEVLRRIKNEESNEFIRLGLAKFKSKHQYGALLGKYSKPICKYVEFLDLLISMDKRKEFKQLCDAIVATNCIYHK